MNTTTSKVSVQDVLDGKAECPFPLDVIPNRMGINLCSVDAVSWVIQDDGQLVTMTIHFDPKVSA